MKDFNRIVNQLNKFKTLKENVYEAFQNGSQINEMQAWETLGEIFSEEALSAIKQINNRRKNIGETVIIAGISLFYENQEEALQILAEYATQLKPNIYKKEEKLFWKRCENGVKRSINLLEAGIEAELFDIRNSSGDSQRLNDIKRDLTGPEWDNYIKAYENSRD